MSVWMPGNKDRTVFSVDAPANRAGRDALPAEFMELPMPTLLVRQKGDAWTRPFVTVFEPYFESDGPAIQSVRAAKVEGDATGLAAGVVEARASENGRPAFTVTLLQDDVAERSWKVEGVTFQGTFGAVLSRGAGIAEIYLGRGLSLGTPEASLASAGKSPVSASLIRTPDGWRYSSSGDVKAELTFPAPKSVSSVSGWRLYAESKGAGKAVEGATLRLIKLPSGDAVVAVSCLLPAGHNLQLGLRK